MEEGSCGTHLTTLTRLIHPPFPRVRPWSKPSSARHPRWRSSLPRQLTNGCPVPQQPDPRGVPSANSTSGSQTDGKFLYVGLGAGVLGGEGLGWDLSVQVVMRGCACGHKCECSRVGRPGLKASVCYLAAGLAGQVSELLACIISFAFIKYLLNALTMCQALFQALRAWQHSSVQSPSGGRLFATP